MTVINKIGLEAEFFLTNKKGDLLFPRASGFSSDDFVILGEFRADPGETRAETLSNFMNKWYILQEKARSKTKIIDIEPFKTVDGDFFAKILRTMGTKEVSQAKNLYGTDILKETDAQVTRGKIVGHNLSIGLHIHFSSTEETSVSYTTDEAWMYNQVSFPISVGELPETTVTLWDRTFNKEPETREVKSVSSRITKPVLEKIVKEFDEKILPDYAPRKKLKFRNPGFYEIKDHGGFEYRSLPMSQKVLDNLYDIVDFGFSLMEDLDI